MTTITLNYDVSTAAVERVRAMLADTALRNPNWGGAEFVIERGEATCLSDCDEINGAALLGDVFNAIDGE